MELKYRETYLKTQAKNAKWNLPISRHESVTAERFGGFDFKHMGRFQRTHIRKQKSRASLLLPKNLEIDTTLTNSATYWQTSTRPKRWPWQEYTPMYLSPTLSQDSKRILRPIALLASFCFHCQKRRSSDQKSFFWTGLFTPIKRLVASSSRLPLWYPNCHCRSKMCNNVFYWTYVLNNKKY